MSNMDTSQTQSSIQQEHVDTQQEPRQEVASDVHVPENESQTGQNMKRANSLIRSFGYAGQGIAAASHERNFKVECVFAIVALILCLVLQVPTWAWVAVVICIGVQLALETLNTAIEAVVDLASPQLHPLAKRAKDCAAGAALITACMSVAVACIVYIPALLNILSIL